MKDHTWLVCWEFDMHGLKRIVYDRIDYCDCTRFEFIPSPCQNAETLHEYNEFRKHYKLENA